MTDLVSITKVGEPKLRILRSTLAEHVRLGWVEAEDEPEDEPTDPKPKLSLKK